MLKLGEQQTRELRRLQLGELLLRNLNALGQEAERDPLTGDILARDGRGHVRRLHLDPLGYVGGVTTPLNRRWHMENDSEGHLQALTLPSGMRFGMRYQGSKLVEISDDQQHVWRISYDAQGQPRKLTHPDQTATVLEHQASGLPTLLQDRLGGVTCFEYDERERLTTLTDPGGRRTRFTYGAGPNPHRVERPDGSAEHYTYDASGRLLSCSVGQMPLFTVAYEGTSHREIRYADGVVLHLTQDARGRVTRAAGPEGEVEFTYDEQGKLVRERQDEQVIEYTYDEAGLLTALVLPSGEQVRYGYDADLRLAEVTDWNGGLHTMEHLPNDRGHQFHAANGVTTSVGLSKAGLPQWSESRHGGANGALLFRQDYTHDEQGRLLSTKDSEHAERSFHYDAEGRLLATQSAGLPDEEFAYDACGNRVRANGEQASFDAADRLLYQGEQQCAYDERGNLISLHEPAGQWYFEYDARNLLVRARTPAGLEVTFGYDALGRRLWKRTARREVRYLWAGEHLVREERREQGQVTIQDYLYQPGTHVPLAMRVDGQVYLFHTNLQGAPERITDWLGRVVWSAVYGAFGLASVSGRVDNPLRLPGQYHDEETGLHYNRFRYYAPRLGRYTSPDPLKWLNGTHFYAYAHNDPINRTDPLGLWSWGGRAVGGGRRRGGGGGGGRGRSGLASTAAGRRRGHGRGAGRQHGPERRGILPLLLPGRGRQGVADDGPLRRRIAAACRGRPPCRGRGGRGAGHRGDRGYGGPRHVVGRHVDGAEKWIFCSRNGRSRRGREGLR
ncbi:hypothetical protein CYFUS_007251 [Cystobacter fuscus]|uniref:Teneurin-like YD-shell domain-containing protein n=1 Tax=Cystobacter fuscus TaxID=43 RepID=A0A250JEF9_9BACT|nr:RHS repeat-associated core domain-containing protein [Cystobacter fuscus]ATB41781.1 hypothetical protein CYFUS_007251 [Cystobacter fuscus]